MENKYYSYKCDKCTYRRGEPLEDIINDLKQIHIIQMYHCYHWNNDGIYERLNIIPDLYYSRYDCYTYLFDSFFLKNHILYLQSTKIFVDDSGNICKQGLKYIDYNEKIPMIIINDPTNFNYLESIFLGLGYEIKKIKYVYFEIVKRTNTKPAIKKTTNFECIQ